MVIASAAPSQALVLKINNDLFKTIESQYHIGQGKMPGSVHAKLRNVLKGTFKELRFRPEERLEDSTREAGYGIPVLGRGFCDFYESENL